MTNVINILEETDEAEETRPIGLWVTSSGFHPGKSSSSLLWGTIIKMRK